MQSSLIRTFSLVYLYVTYNIKTSVVTLDFYLAILQQNIPLHFYLMNSLQTCILIHIFMKREIKIWREIWFMY